MLIEINQVMQILYSNIEPMHFSTDSNLLIPLQNITLFLLFCTLFFHLTKINQSRKKVVKHKYFNKKFNFQMTGAWNPLELPQISSCNMCVPDSLMIQM